MVDVIVQLLKYGLVLGLVVAWASILLPPVLRFVGGRVGRGADSVGSFRSHMSSLGRGAGRTGPVSVIDLTHGSVASMRATSTPPLTARPSARRVSARKRRRDILTGLLGATGLLLLVGLVVGGLAWALFGLSAVLLVAYVGLLWAMHQSALERQRKVTYLPRTQVAPSHHAELRRAGAGQA